MSISKTFEQAEKFFNENKDSLLDIMFNELKEGVSVDDQTDYDDDGELIYNQIVLWGNGFDLCCQDSDMNGAGKGNAHYDNSGADSGFDELQDLLINDDRTNALYAEDEFHAKEFIRDFARLIADKLVAHFDVESMFLCNNED